MEARSRGAGRCAYLLEHCVGAACRARVRSEVGRLLPTHQAAMPLGSAPGRTFADDPRPAASQCDPLEHRRVVLPRGAANKGAAHVRRKPSRKVACGDAGSAAGY